MIPRVALLAAAVGLICGGLLAGDVSRIAGTMTYGNFDVPPEEGQSGVMYLSPGVDDLAAAKVYRFAPENPIVWHPLAALGILFGLLLFWRTWKARDLRTSPRWLVQWLGFVGTRIGVLRAAQVFPVTRCALGVVPVLNCQACEMANAACPIGAMQGALRLHEFPAFAVGVVVLSGLAAGRWFCGWLCPFGFIEDLLDRISRPRLTIPKGLEWGRFVVLGLTLLAPLILGLVGVTRLFPFCSTLCVSGGLLGRLPYLLTTGAPALADVLHEPSKHAGSLVLLSLHALLLLGWALLALSVAGRFWCRYLCPLGAALGLFNKVSFVQVTHDATACASCTTCSSVCPMGLSADQDDFLAWTGCIRCGRCIQACPSGNRRWSFGSRNAEVGMRSGRPEAGSQSVDLNCPGPGCGAGSCSVLRPIAPLTGRPEDA